MSITYDEVKITQEYEIFTIDEGVNRPVHLPKCHKLVKSINHYGILLPILVDKDLVVLDGQHRLRLAELAGLPVPYLIVKGDLPDNSATSFIRELNTTGRKHTPEDMLAMLANEGYEGAAVLYNIYSEYQEDGLKVATLLPMLNPKLRTAALVRPDKIFPIGISQIKTLKNKLRMLFELKEQIENARYADRFIGAKYAASLSRAMSRPEYIHDHFCERLRKTKPSDSNFPSVTSDSTEASKVIKKIYNKQLNGLVELGL